MSNLPALSKYGDARQPDGAKMLQFQNAMANGHSKDNPEGIVNIAVAENSVVWDDLIEIFERKFKLRHIDLTYGDSLQGSIRLRHALASLFNSDYFKARVPVKPDDLIMGNGLLSVLSQLSRALVDPGNGILLAAPYYHGFDLAFDMQTGVRAVGVEVPFEDMFTEREIGWFEKALEEFNSSGPQKIQVILLCNPQNPYGRCYPPEIIEAYAAFAERHNLHLISDEIYALSTFASEDIPNPTPFTSILTVDLDKVRDGHSDESKADPSESRSSDGDVKDPTGSNTPSTVKVNPDRVHMVYGMSKDFDANGFRAGVLYTRNEALKTALVATTLFMLVGSPGAGLWWGLLEDEETLDSFIASNRAGLRTSYEHMAGWLKFHNIPYIPSEAGHFVMVNFRGVVSDEALGFTGSLVNANATYSSDSDGGPLSESDSASKNLHESSEPSGSLSPAVSLASAIGISSSHSLGEREMLLTNHWASHGVVVGRGTGFHMYEPGWYRFTFSVRRETVDVALRRIEKSLGWERWEGLNVP